MLIATSQTKPENLDSRVIRPGRFDHWVEVPLPSKKTGGMSSIRFVTAPHKIDEFLAITENWPIPEVKRRSLNYVQRDQIAFSPPLASRELIESLPVRDMSAAGVEILVQRTAANLMFNFNVLVNFSKFVRFSGTFTFVNRRYHIEPPPVSDVYCFRC